MNGMNFLDDYKGDCDLIFMDIAMPHMDGLETAAALRKRGDNTCLIFITSMAQYALKGYEVNAFDFLVKPLAYELFCIKFLDGIKVNFDNLFWREQVGIRHISKKISG